MSAPSYTIGGSQVAAAVGIDPYRSPVMLWAQMLGKIAPYESEAAEWGRRLEPLVREKVAETYEVMPAPAEGFVDTERPWAVGHPDGFATMHHGSRGILEVKTAGHFAWRGSEVPLAYQAQCQWYMHLTDTEWALVAALIAGQRFEVHQVARDQGAIDTMLVLAEGFLEHVRTATPPPPDGSDSSREAIRELFPGASEGRKVRLSRAEWETVQELRGLREQLAAVKEQIAERENVLKLAMRDAETAVSPHDTEALHWRNVQARRLDTSALKEAHPELYEEFSTVTTTRRFSVV